MQQSLRNLDIFKSLQQQVSILCNNPAITFYFSCAHPIISISFENQAIGFCCRHCNRADCVFRSTSAILHLFFNPYPLFVSLQFRLSKHVQAQERLRGGHDDTTNSSKGIGGVAISNAIQSTRCHPGSRAGHNGARIGTGCCRCQGGRNKHHGGFNMILTNPIGLDDGKRIGTTGYRGSGAKRGLCRRTTCRRTQKEFRDKQGAQQSQCLKHNQQRVLRIQSRLFDWNQ